MPAHIKDTRGSTRYEKMKLFHGDPTRCATCGSKLLKGQVGNVRRCNACRAKDPGRPTPSTVIVKPRAAEPPPKRSWWTDAKPDQFTATCSQQPFSGHRLTLPLNHKGMFSE